MTSALELYLSTVKNKVVEEFDFANKKVKYTKNLKNRLDRIYYQNLLMN